MSTLGVLKPKTGSITNTISAPECIIIFNSATVGIAKSFQGSIDYGYKPIMELDSIIPREIMPGPVRVSFSISGYMVRSASLQDAGFFTPAGNNMLNKYVTMVIVDRRNDNIILNYPAAVIDSLSITSSSNECFTFDVSGIAFTQLQDTIEPVAPQYTGIPRSTI